MDIEMGIQGWLFVIGTTLVLAILVDGFRRMLREQNDPIRMGNDLDEKSAGSDEYGSELPNGGARVVGYREDAEEATDQASQADQSVPMLMDPIDVLMQDSAPKLAAVNAPKSGKLPEPALDLPSGDVAEVVAVAMAANETEGEVDPSLLVAPKVEGEEIVVITALARDTDGFRGIDLVEVLLACGLRYGDMHIFHRHEQDNGKGPVQFQVANILEPGTFCLNQMQQADYRTPGVAFFLSLPGPDDSIKAYDYMVSTAQCLVRNLQGELRDEFSSVMTQQTIEHNRQRIREYERKRLSHGAVAEMS